MPSNAAAVEIFQGIADLLDVMGERFKPEAYRRAARSIESLTEDLAAFAARNELRSIPGVGEAIEEKIREYLETGKISYFERLQKDVPAGVAEMLRIPGLGPKTARRFWVEMGIEGPSELLGALDAGRLTGVKGFGPKKIAQIRAAVEAHRTSAAGTRLPIEEAYPIAQALVRGLRDGAGADRVEVAGSFRRGRETVGDLDILVTSDAPERAFDVFSGLPEVREIVLRGSTKETVRLRNGLQVDLRVVDSASFGAALVYFTGSKDHNVQIRSLAKEQGLRVNEYAVTRGEERVAGATEEEVYACLGLTWIPPELREARGEVDAASRGPLPTLVTESDVRGDLHVHLPVDAEPTAVDRLVRAARDRGLSYLGVVVEGVDANGTEFVLSDPVRERLGELSTSRLALHRVSEVDLHAIGRGGPPGRSATDWRVIRPTARAPVPAPPFGRDVAVVLVAHRGGGGNEEHRAAWTAFAREFGASVEVGPGPERLDSNSARQARESGLSLAVPTGMAEGVDSPTGPVALRFARRAGARPEDVRNAQAGAPVSGARTASGG